MATNVPCVKPAPSRGSVATAGFEMRKSAFFASLSIDLEKQMCIDTTGSMCQQPPHFHFLQDRLFCDELYVD